MRFVVLPQAVRRVIPPLMNDFIGLQKDTALIGVIGVLDGFRRAQIYAGQNFNLSSFTVLALCFVVITFPMTRFTDRLLRRDQERLRIGGGDRPWLTTAASSSWRIRGPSGQLRASSADHQVLNGIDLTVGEHELVSLIGASGCGKSTLLRCVNALEPIQGGTISLQGRVVSGKDVDVDEHRRDVGIVFQSFNLFPHMTVLQNITLAPARCSGSSVSRPRSGPTRCCSGSGCTKRKQYPDSLSGGQQQVAIVRALAMRPKLLLLDEITGALDPELVAEVLNIVREAGRGEHDHARGHPRDVLRPRGLQPGLLPRPGGHPRAGPARADLLGAERPRTQAFLKRIIEAGRL